MAKVLVVEDELSIRSIVGKVLEEAGYGVAVACNGAEALDQMRAAPSDCILLDLNMPVMDGKSFLAAWRAEPGYIKVPVVLFTSELDPVTTAAGMEVQACISKPFDIDAVSDTVSRVLSVSASPQRDGLTERSDGVADSGQALCQYAPSALPSQVAVLRQRAHQTRRAIARSRCTISKAEACLDRAGQRI
jgi:two-component system, chemotaxis family, chemotaxis protein CheY